MSDTETSTTGTEAFAPDMPYYIDRIKFLGDDEPVPYRELSVHKADKYARPPVRRALIELTFPESGRSWAVVVARGDAEEDCMWKMAYEIQQEGQVLQDVGEIAAPVPLPLRDLDGLYFKAAGEEHYRMAALRVLSREQVGPFWTLLGYWVSEVRNRLPLARKQTVAFEKPINVSFFYPAVERWTGSKYEVVGDECYLSEDILEEFATLIAPRTAVKLEAQLQHVGSL